MTPWATILKERDSYRSLRRDARESDDAFAAGIGEQEQTRMRDIVLLIRKVVALYSRVDSTMLHAKDRTSDLDKIMGATTFLGWFITLGDRGPDEESFFAALQEAISAEYRLRLHIPFSYRQEAIERWRAGATLGEWTAWLAGVIIDLPPNS